MHYQEKLVLKNILDTKKTNFWPIDSGEALEKNTIICVNDKVFKIPWKRREKVVEKNQKIWKETKKIAKDL